MNDEPRERHPLFFIHCGDPDYGDPPESALDLHESAKQSAWIWEMLRQQQDWGRAHDPLYEPHTDHEGNAL